MASLRCLLSCFCLLAMAANANARLLLHGGNNTLLQKVCSYSENSDVDFCLSILESDPESSKADAKGLTKIIVKAATENATESASYLSKLLRQPKPIELNGSLSACYEEYQSALFRLKDIPKQIDASSYYNAQLYLTSPLNVNTGCGESFIHFPYPPELAKRGGALERICAVAIAIIVRFFIGNPN